MAKAYFTGRPNGFGASSGVGQVGQVPGKIELCSTTTAIFFLQCKLLELRIERGGKAPIFGIKATLISIEVTTRFFASAPKACARATQPFHSEIRAAAQLVARLTRIREVRDYSCS